jgi:Cytochrome c554 and c-prime
LRSREVKWRYLLQAALLSTLAFNVLVARCQLSTEDHLAEPGFWPRQSHTSNEVFVGNEACAKCHAGMVASQEMTPMAQTAMPASVADILHAHPDMSFKPNQYNYRIKTSSIKGASESLYSITDGGQTLSFPLLWAFGTGRVGQSYLFKKDDGRFYEARVTYFRSLKTLGFTPARALLSPANIDDAMYRVIPQAEVMQCFSCHTTAASVGGTFDEKHLIPGVKCEACHGPGLNHVSAMHSRRAGGKQVDKLEIFNPANLSPTDSVEFCGACHGSWWDVKLAKVKGVSTARSAPYRLVTSKCWGKGDDSRLICTACHNPHEPLETRSSAYDSACLKCHTLRSGAKTSQGSPSNPHAVDAVRRGAACPIGSANCTTCHMQKVFVPEMNDTFTDHRVRIARAGEPFPE